MEPVGRKGMFYLAAAVSDFFLPCHRVVSSLAPRTSPYTRPSGRSMGRVQNADLIVASQCKQSEHKIQSTKGNLTLEMDQVPKVLRPLVQEWIPDAYIVSFKVRVSPLSSLYRCVHD